MATGLYTMATGLYKKLYTKQTVQCHYPQSAPKKAKHCIIETLVDQ